jgi:precorrin-2 C20-methyltransferase/precorrin-3B C17-methyltransferase
MHMHTRLTQRFDAVIVPGAPVSAASAATATPWSG